MANIIITGSSGFIGNELMNHFSQKGHQIFAFQRKPQKELRSNVEFVKYSLEDKLEDEYFKKADFCIHTAYIKNTHNNVSINVKGSSDLFDKCKKYNVQFIFLSSLSAQKSITSDYSKSKLKVEEYLNNQAIILRLGLVIGNGGLFKTMFDFIKKSPIVPIFNGGNQQLQFVSINDVKNVCELLICNYYYGNFVIINKKPIKIKEFYRILALHLDKIFFYLSLPINLMYGFLTLVESIGVKLPITTENLTGLKQMNPLQQILPKGMSEDEICSIEEALISIK